MNSSALKNLQGYLETEHKCREKYPQIDECESIWNTTMDVKECQNIMNLFRNCFRDYKPSAYQHKGGKPKQD
ncbi:unnamed protein product [Paramecium octaurelia]|uniref:Uncharacterized protein n=1 Tax=Paramecium octaurelia TaxID=43137 RepID=A0A8S1X1C7_PAROT|nr:unnamed protein product [Paramecium octaurelia]